jgi:hypothetical protein
VTCGKHVFQSNVQTLNLVQHEKINFWEDAIISFKDYMFMLIHIKVHDINTHCYNVDINSNLHFVD